MWNLSRFLCEYFTFSIRKFVKSQHCLATSFLMYTYGLLTLPASYDLAGNRLNITTSEVNYSNVQCQCHIAKTISGWQDLNPGPRGLKPCALLYRYPFIDLSSLWTSGRKFKIMHPFCWWRARLVYCLFLNQPTLKLC